MLAQEAHRGQYRRNGDLYLEHPVAVALILAENGADADTVVAAVLHDGADPAASVSLDHVQREFGGVVSELLAAFTALDESTTTTPDDVPDSVDRRVLQLKVADRLHNMRTIGWLEPEKQCRKAGHIRDVVAPAARKIGLTDLAHELGDLAAATLRAHSPVLPLDRTHPGAAASLREGMDETLTVLRLGIPPTLARTFRSTNTVESMISICRTHASNVKNWRDGTMALRWCAAGMVEAGKQFRRVNGPMHLRSLRDTLERNTHPVGATDHTDAASAA